jgi:hypothetical protein
MKELHTRSGVHNVLILGLAVPVAGKNFLVIVWVRQYVFTPGIERLSNACSAGMLGAM